MNDDDLTPHFRRLTHSAALVGEFDDRPERQTELLAWVLESVRAIAAARGLALEASGWEECQSTHATVCKSAGWHTLTSASRGWSEVEIAAAEVERQERAEQPHFRTIIEAGAGFAPGELRRPDACDPAEDGAERVMQAAETWWGRRG